MNTIFTENGALNESFDILDRFFDNLLEINYSEQTMICVKWNEDTEHRMPNGIRMILNDAVDFLINNVIVKEDGDVLLDSIKMVSEKTDSNEILRFHIKNRNGAEPLCVGEIICTGHSCWFGFNNTEKLKRKFSINSENYFEGKAESKVKIQTFGFFEVFVDGKAVLFRSKKAKELLALLVDRKGGYVSSNEAITYLWEDDVADEKTLSRYRKVAMRLNDTLKEYGIENIIENIDGQRRIVPENVSCDLYDYLSDRTKNGALFNGNYMLNYSWGEITLAGL